MKQSSLIAQYAISPQKKTEKNMQNNIILTCFVLALKETVKKKT